MNKLVLRTSSDSIRADLRSLWHDPNSLLDIRGKTVTTIHDLTALRVYDPDKNRFGFLRLKQQIYAGVIKRVVKKSKTVIVPSEFVKQDLVKFSGVSQEIKKLTHEAADKIAEPPAPLPDLQNSKFIMYVGRPTPHKNLSKLVEAFYLLQKQHPTPKLVLVGQNRCKL
jgi:glycosyltransferase involved in cell wall biosynthesis